MPLRAAPALVEGAGDPEVGVGLRTAPKPGFAGMPWAPPGATFPVDVRWVRASAPKGAEPMQSAQTAMTPNPRAVAHGPGAGEGKWHALWTRSHFEQRVFDQLAARGFHPFLPKIDLWSERGRTPHRVSVPMFPGYLFLHDTLDPRRYIEVCQTRGLVALMGQRWDRLAEIPDEEIAAIAKLERVDLPKRPHPFLHTGQRVRITHGPLAGIEGLLLELKADRQLLVVSIALLRRSVAVEVEYGSAAPA